MFSLLYGFWEYISRKEELRILILGLDKAGADLSGLSMRMAVSSLCDKFKGGLLPCRKDYAPREAQDNLHRVPRPRC